MAEEREVMVQEEVPKEKKIRKWAKAGGKGKRSYVKSGNYRKTTHETRETTVRAASETHSQADAPWANPASLEAPPARPGMVQRWIRVSSRGKNEPTNLSRKLREGWQPRRADSIPGNFHMPVISGGNFSGAIGVDGMVLMEMPKARNDQRNRHYEKRKERLTESINMQLAEASRNRGRSGFGPIEIAQKTQVGTLREVRVAADD